VHDARIAALFRANSEALRRPEDPPSPESGAFQASTDMGNVSSYIPSIHPFMRLGSWPVANHQPEFTALCVTAEADATVVAGATAMAWTAIDLASDTAVALDLIGASDRQEPVHVRALADAAGGR
jgi:hypothetical protein